MTNQKLDNSQIWLALLIPILLILLWGVQNQQEASILIDNPKLIFSFLIYKFGFVQLIFGTVAIVLIVWLLINSPMSEKGFVRGSRKTSSTQLQSTLKKQVRSRSGKQPKSVLADELLLQIGGITIPSEYENRGFFAFGSPGSGKTQAISQMVATLKQRSDFRGIVFDRSGEMLEKFYNPKLDIIFNPFDARSCHWSHVFEPARPETMAAGLIPAESGKNAFFSTAGRAVMSELFRTTQNNQELFHLLQSDTKTLISFLQGTLAARYLGEERVATSVLSTVTNNCEFYRSLVNSQNKAISFFKWGATDSPRWIFISLRENDTELLKPLYTLVFELMLRGLLSNEHRARKTAIVIDELGALNQLPSLDRLLSESRKFLGCPILGTQTEAQATKIYGLENTRIILQGTKTKLILNCADPKTAKTMSDVIGKQEIIHFSNNRSRSRSYQSGKSGTSSSVTKNEQLRESYVVTPSQLQDLPDLEGYLKISGLPTSYVKIKYKKFDAINQRFVPTQPLPQVEQKKTIKQHWSKFIKRNGY